MVQNPAQFDTKLDQPEPQTDEPFPMVRVYALLDAHRRSVYIGVTAGDEEVRAYRHWVRRYDLDVQRWNPRLAEWLRSLDGPPLVSRICEAPYAQRHLVEGAAIVAYRQAGYLLPLNVRVGQRWTDEGRARIGAGMRRYRAKQRAAALAV
ncbi:hypothetical protein [Streptomyces sp. NBC_01451]|uniref:hypothetical protein n=1 Tax=Streptomyces sp. NBC_01451 TaxID=2903872 RepID=UPI002E2FE735|nr:hypothetical protein [Streptomyces sp. NBC_01451]